MNVDKIPPQIAQILQKSLARVRRILFIRGLALTLAVGLIVLLTNIAIDAMVVIFSSVVRWSLWGAAVAIIGFTAWSSLIRPLRRKFTAKEIASLIERNHPELDERLTTVVELSQSGEVVPSQELFASVTDAAIQDIKGISPQREFTNRTVKPRLIAFAVCLLILVGLCALFPTAMQRLILRAVAPSAEVDNVYASSLHVTPGNLTILEGTPVTVSLAVDGGFPSKAFVRTTRKNSGESVERMTRVNEVSQEGRAIYEFTFPAARESFSYRMNCGSAVTRRYDIEVVPEPAYSDCKIILNHPEYTGRPPTTYTNTADIVGLVGTKVFVDIKASRSGLTGEANFPDVRVPCEQGANNRMKFALTLTPKSAGNWFIALGDQNGFSNTLQTAKVQIIEDTPPLVALADEIPTEVKLMKTGDMSLLYTIKEDFSLASVALEMLTGTTWEEIAVLSPEKSDSVTWTGVARAIFADKDLSKVNRLRLRIRATDTRPAELGGPGIGYSPEVSIVFVNNRTSLAQQSLNSQIKEADDLIRQVTISFENTIRYLENARHFTDTVEWRRHNSLNQLKGAKTHASGTENSLTTLISSLKDTPLDDGIPLFQPVLDDHVTPDRARVEDIYLITEPSDKDAAVGESRKTWIEDLALFKEAARKFKVLSEAARELQKLADFAEREKLLAELAEQEKLTAEEFAKKENELLEEFKRDFNERLRDLDFTREKKDLDLMQKRLDTLKNKQKEFQDRLEATSPDNEEENKRIRSEQNSLADQIRRQDQELEHVLNRVEQKVGNASEDQMETAQPLKEARNDLSDANDQAMDALQEMRNGNHEDAKKAMEATQENLTDAQQKVSNAKNRMDEKAAAAKNEPNAFQEMLDKLQEAAESAQNAAEAAKQEAATNPLTGEPIKAEAGQQQGTNDEKPKGGDRPMEGQQNGQQQQQKPSVAQQAMNEAAQKAMQAAQQMKNNLQQQAENKNLSAEQFQNQTQQPQNSNTQSSSQQGLSNQHGPLPPQARGVQGEPPPEEGDQAWFKMKTESSAQGESDTMSDVPEEYRGLVREYFKALEEGSRK